MPSKTEFYELLHGLLTELQSASVWWQIIVLLVSFGAAWWLQAHKIRHAPLGERCDDAAARADRVDHCECPRQAVALDQVADGAVDHG